jgi:hypothetical protein
MNTFSTRHIDLRIGERIVLDGGRIEVEAERKSGRLIRLKVSASQDIEIRQDTQDGTPAMRAITGM